MITISRILGHGFDSILYGIVYIGKLGNPHHSKNFFEMFGETGNTDLLLILPGLSKDLYEYCDAAAVDVGFFFKLDENFFGRFLFVRAIVGLINIRFGMGSNVTLYVQKGNVVLSLQLDFVFRLHGQFVPYYAG